MPVRHRPSPSQPTPNLVQGYLMPVGHPRLRERRQSRYGLDASHRTNSGLGCPLVVASPSYQALSYRQPPREQRKQGSHGEQPASNGDESGFHWTPRRRKDFCLSEAYGIKSERAEGVAARRRALTKPT